MLKYVAPFLFLLLSACSKPTPPKVAPVEVPALTPKPSPKASSSDTTVDRHTWSLTFPGEWKVEDIEGGIMAETLRERGRFTSIVFVNEEKLEDPMSPEAYALEDSESIPGEIGKADKVISITRVPVKFGGTPGMYTMVFTENDFLAMALSVESKAGTRGYNLVCIGDAEAPSNYELCSYLITHLTLK